MDGGGCGGAENWSEAVEDMVDRGDVHGAIHLLDSIVSKLDLDCSESELSRLRLSSALGDLADLHASLGSSLKADDLRSRAFSLRAQPPPISRSDPPPLDCKPTEGKASAREEIRVSSQSNNSGEEKHQEEEEDDWEAIADRAVALNEELLTSKEVAGFSSSTSWKDVQQKTPRRRGRGSFLYEKSCLYSEQDDVGPTSVVNAVPDDEAEHSGEETGRISDSRYGTSHVLVLYDFLPSTRTTDLETLFEGFKDRGFAIRWVNDTTALAVFRTPSIAHEAQHSVHCPFKVRILDADDNLLNQISVKDLEPPYPRPKTSARTAQRLIAQVVGIKPSSEFGSNELRKQEAARKERIAARQLLRDDAWGSDE